jgi:hypothetical protein
MRNGACWPHFSMTRSLAPSSSASLERLLALLSLSQHMLRVLEGDEMVE